MAKKKKAIQLTPAQEREQRAQQITLLQTELNGLRASMLANVSSWKYEQMRDALTRANNVRKEIDKLMRK